MMQPPDFDALARQYLDVWQNQFNRMAQDPAMATVMAHVLSALTRGAQTVVANPPQQASPPDDDITASHRPHNREHGRGQHGGQNNPQPTDGPASAAPISGDGGVDVSGLLGRIATLEERVAVLERTTGAKPTAKPP